MKVVSIADSLLAALSPIRMFSGWQIRIRRFFQNWISHRANAIALLVGLSQLVCIQDAVPQACATMQTDNNGQVLNQGGNGPAWVWTGTGAFNLDQNSNGLITGNEGYPNCNPGANPPDFYTTTGIMNNNGGFSLTSTYQGSYPGCATTLTMSGTVSAPGCNVANGNWSNSGGLSGTFKMTHGCYYPTGETNQAFQGWAQQIQGSFVYEKAIFQVQLAPLVFNWGGRTISETFPQPAVDGCWWPLSAIPKLVTIATRSTTVDSTAAYSDSIGPLTIAVDYYRQQGRTPCSLTTQQVLVIDCPNPPGNLTYSTNTQIDTIGPILLTITRGNNPSISEVFGAPAPALTLPAILLNLLFPPS